ncbi:MAG: GDYXXLXY domain-containing protein [Victivallaceae bacterium]
MNYKIIKITLFAIVIAAMLAVPAFMINKGEEVLNKGRIYIFKAAPVDPYDYFRGRYVNIRIEKNYVPVSPDTTLDFKSNEAVYASIKNDKDGLAYFDNLSRTVPENGDYVKVNFSYHDKDKAYLLIPFNQFFMNEKMAPEAERVVREALLKRRDSCVIKLRVHNDTAVIEDLLINNTPIRKYILDLQKSGNKK